MRTLIYGMQSSGASWICWTMAQDPGTAAIIDLFNHVPCPPAAAFRRCKHAVVKQTVGLKHSIEKTLVAFKPRRVVLVTRDEDAVTASLMRRRGNRFIRGGLREIRRKLAEFHRVLKTPELYDEIVRYEDVAASPPPLTRSLEEIVRYNHKRCVWSRKIRRWGIGGIHLADEERARLDHLIHKRTGRARK